MESVKQRCGDNGERKMPEPVIVAYVLPWWMQWIQVFGVAVISGLGAWIAYRQARIATAKLNLDLYDRRFKVFDGARNLVSMILGEGKIIPASLSLFNIRVADVTFLFDADVENYVINLRKKAVALYTKGNQLSGMEELSERRNALIDQIAELEMDFASEYERMVKVFKPYLKLGNI
jgi:hypothetical protein